jgi:hypothetical protein
VLLAVGMEAHGRPLQPDPYIEFVDLLRVLPAHNEDVLTPQCRGDQKTYMIDVNTSRTPEAGAHSLS